MRIMIEQFFHVGIPVVELEQCKSFLCDIFDFQLEAEFESDASKTYGIAYGLLQIAFLKCPGGRIELLKNIHPDFIPPPRTGRRVPTYHIAVYVEDLETMMERVKTAGFEIWTEGIRSAPDNHPVVPGCRGVYVSGPDNIVVEMLERPKKALE